MSLRSRLTLFVAVASAIVVTAVAAAAYLSAAREIYAEIDQFLAQRSIALGGFSNPEDASHMMRFPDQFFAFSRSELIEADSVVQVLNPDGVAIIRSGRLPVFALDLAIAGGDEDGQIRTVVINGGRWRLNTAPIELGGAFDPPLGAIQIARSLTETDAVLAGMRLRMLAVGGLGVAMAALGAWFVAGRALKPVGDLTSAAEHVASTQDLRSPIDLERDDELGRLASSFNSMLEALAQSREQQQQLVADAGHELRTPLTSLRTNIELLARADSMPTDQRKEIMSDAKLELEELSILVAELVDLASDRAVDEPMDEVRLDHLVIAVAERYERRWNRVITTSVEPVVLEGRPSRLERALGNLIDNAVKWSSPDSPIEITQQGGIVHVRDHGAGIESEDLPRIFDRFYRATSARTMPGSGLGLSIVKQVAEEHGGNVSASNHPDGGAIVGLELANTEQVETVH